MGSIAAFLDTLSKDRVYQQFINANFWKDYQ
jgi:hypothetical protein